MSENQKSQKFYFDRKGTIKEIVYSEGEKVWVQYKFDKI